MRRHISAAFFAAFVSLGAASAAQAQTLPFSLEVRGGGAIPTGDWNEDDAVETGIGFGAAVKFSPTPLVGVYAGWDRFSFSADDSELDISLNDSAFRLGAEVNVPAATLPVSPFVSAGLVYGKSEVEGSVEGGSASIESDSSIGFEGSIGVQFAAGPVSVRPSVGYRTRSVEFNLGDTEITADEDISYLTFVIGVSFTP